MTIARNVLARVLVQFGGSVSFPEEFGGMEDGGADGQRGEVGWYGGVSWSEGIWGAMVLTWTSSWH